ncbi:HxlR family transcriptional regulator [Mycolicibacterium anyangense]|uniref:HxlR family transcriptional regulator n=2 Tax=Mycolicibacterium anyangense TaxID=1431246 RepID=A0A6N4W9S6_9MYCO|nr:HxlR family transcriptional regulator [Mycolicibacterium anyangense]
MSEPSPFQLESGGTNAVGRMLALLGDEWTLLIVRESLLGATRFSDFATLPISNAVLTARLQTLVVDGLLERQIYQQQPLRAGYVPTPACRGLWPVLVSIWHWERTWVGEHVGTLPVMRHRRCGRDFAPQLHCADCDTAADVGSITATWGTSGGWQRSVPRAVTRRRLRSGTSDQASFFPQTMAIFGNRHAAAIIGAALLGTRRFGDFQSRLDAPAAVIADRLKVFCTIGVLQAAAHPVRSDWSEYHLTPKGLAFYPVVATAIDWAESTYLSPEGPALLQVHSCGAEFVPSLVCDQCAQQLTAGSIEIVPHRDAEARNA